jgi:hypothetical protein
MATEADGRIWAPLLLDLFVSADNALVPRFLARFPKLLAEGLTRWPSPTLLPAFVAKARVDRLRCIVVAPFSPPDSVRPARASASVVTGQH